MKKAVDISCFDREVDFNKVKKDGYVAVIIRAGYGMTNVDPYFYEHIQQANKADIPVGIYWFSYSWTVDMAKKEAKKCLELIKPYRVQLPVYFDFEYDSDAYAKRQGHAVSNATLNQMANAFCSEVEKAGYQAGIYFNKDYKNNRFYKELLNSYSKWYAWYNKELDDYTVDLWQYTSSGEVDGIPAEREDLDYIVNERIINRPVGEDRVETEQEEYVKALQIALNTSYNLKLPVDGKFGKMTEAAVTINYLFYKRPTIKNAHVSWLQGTLKTLGYEIKVDGSYGPATEKVVKQFQYDYELYVDGWAGPNTHRKLIEVLGNE